MAELDIFMESNVNKSDATKKQYKTQYNKLFKLTGKPIAETSEKKIIEILNEIDNKNTAQALLNIALLIRKLNKLSVTQLENLREKNKESLNKSVKENNLNLQETLPSYEELIDNMNYLYDKGEYTDYIINYLLINFQVRNQDVDFKIITRKKDAADLTKNYIWLQPNKLTYIRNVYKTANTINPEGTKIFDFRHEVLTNSGYGTKINIITEPKMIVAIKKIFNDKNLRFSAQSADKNIDTFIPNKASIAYYIQKATYKQLGEGKYVKIVINHFRNDIDKLKEISDNRGTSLTTIMASYDIENI